MPLCFILSPIKSQVSIIGPFLFGHSREYNHTFEMNFGEIGQRNQRSAGEINPLPKVAPVKVASRPKVAL